DGDERRRERRLCHPVDRRGGHAAPAVSGGQHEEAIGNHPQRCLLRIGVHASSCRSAAPGWLHASSSRALRRSPAPDHGAHGPAPGYFEPTTFRTKASTGPDTVLSAVSIENTSDI